MKIRISFIVIITCSSYLCFGQEALKTTQFGISVTPQLNATIFKDKEEVEWHSPIGFATAGNIHFDLGSRTQLVSGLEFQYANYYYEDQLMTFIDSIGNLVQTDSYIINNYSLYFIGLPIQMIWKLTSAEKSNHVYLAAGITMRYRFASGGNISVVEQGKTTFQRNIDSYFWAPDKLWLLGTIGIGYEMKCGIHKLSLAPTFEYSPGQLYNDQGSSAISDAHPAFLGISFSYY